MNATTRRVRTIQFTTIAVLLAAYELLAHAHVLYEGVVPPLETIVPALINVLVSPATYANLGVTGGEVLIGFGIGTVLGIIVGLAAGATPWLGAALGPYLDGFATAPKIVFFPIAILLFGTGPASKAALGSLSAFFPVAITVAAALRQMPAVYRRVGRSFNLNPWQMATKIFLPALVPSIVNGMRIGFGLAIIGVLLGEIKLSDRGLGFLAIDDYNHFRIPHMYAFLLVIFVLAVGANVVIGRIEARERRRFS